MVQQLTNDGNIRKRLRNASPMGDMHSTKCKLRRTLMMNCA